MPNIKNKRPIGVFDSGVGGLSVLQELKTLLPYEDFVFLADQKNIPYGGKTKKQLIKFALDITDYFVKDHKIKLLVVACNTATCYTIEAIRNKYPNLLVVGTVPAIKPAAKKTKSKIIAVISTPATFKSEMLKGLIKQYCRGIRVINISAPGLADAIEKNEDVDKLIQRYLRKVKSSKANCLVLGSTHYLFVKDKIQKFLDKRVKILDGNKAIAKQTKNLLQFHQLQNKTRKPGQVAFFSSL